MKNIPQSRELSFYHETEKVWYSVQPSSYARASFMVVRLNENGYGPNVIVIGSLNRCLEYITHRRNNLQKNNYIKA